MGKCKGEQNSLSKRLQLRNQRHFSGWRPGEDVAALPDPLVSAGPPGENLPGAKVLFFPANEVQAHRTIGRTRKAVNTALRVERQRN